MWALVFAGVSAAAGVFNAVDEATANRVIRDQLSKVIAYLETLNSKIDQIQQQNIEILKRIDELPARIRAIVQEVVDNALVDREYATLHSIHLNIVRLGLDRDYRITKPGWKMLSSSLTYVFGRENRLSNIFKLIQYSELALAATRNQARPFIKTLVFEKIQLITLLQKELIARAETDLQTAANLLARAEYIASHNLSADLRSIEEFTYARQPNREMTVTYTEQVCHYRTGPCNEGIEVCRDVTRTRQEPDTPFHNARDQHCQQIDALVMSIREQVTNIKYVSAVLIRLERYLDSIGGVAVTDDQAMMFYPIALPKNMMSTIGNIQIMNDAEDNAFNYYFDDMDVVIVEEKARLDVPYTDGIFAVVTRLCPPV